MIRTGFLRILQNNPAGLRVVVYPDTTPAATTPQDLTGVTAATWVMKATRQTDDDHGDTLTLGDGITLTDPQNGQLDIHIPATLTETAGEIWARLDLTQGDDDPVTAWYGLLNIIDT